MRSKLRQRVTAQPCHIPCPCTPDKVRDTMTLIPMRKEVQGQGHSNTTLAPPMTDRGGAARVLSLLTCSREQLRCGHVPRLPTDTTYILEVHPWHNAVVVPN